MIKRLILLGSLAAALVTASTSAYADSISWGLSKSNCIDSSCASYGTVTVTDTAAGVDVSVVLTSGYFNYNSNGPTLSFSLDPSLVPADAAITNIVLTNSDGSVTYTDATASLPPLGTDAAGLTSNQGDNNVVIQCADCGPQGPMGDTLTTMTFSINGVSTGDFVPTSGGNIKNAPWYFEANTDSSGGGSVLVWANGAGTLTPFTPGGGTPPAVPEPSTLLFLGTGLTALGGAIRRRLSR